MNPDGRLIKEKLDDGNGVLATITLSSTLPSVQAEEYVMESCVIPAKTMKFVNINIEETMSETVMVRGLIQPSTTENA